MKKVIIFPVLSMSLLLQGCFVSKVKVDQTINREAPTGNYDYQEWNHFFLWGFVPNTDLDAEKMCRGLGGVGFVESRFGLLNQIAALLTGGLYSPTTTRVYCSKGQKRV